MNLFSIAKEYIPDVLRSLFSIVNSFFSPLSDFIDSNSNIPFISDVLSILTQAEIFNYSLFDIMFIVGLPSYLVFVIVKFFVDLVL